MRDVVGGGLVIVCSFITFLAKGFQNLGLGFEISTKNNKLGLCLQLFLYCLSVCPKKCCVYQVLDSPNYYRVSIHDDSKTLLALPLPMS